jgi:hypothetical protein
MGERWSFECGLRRGDIVALLQPPSTTDITSVDSDGRFDFRVAYAFVDTVNSIDDDGVKSFDLWSTSSFPDAFGLFTV